MIQEFHPRRRALLRRREVEWRTGQPRSTLYESISKGLFVPPVQIGARAVAWPEQEVETLVRARIAGCTDDEIRKVVARLVAARKLAIPGMAE